MNNEETGKMLARIAEITGRQVGVTTISTWQNVLADVDYEDAVRAVNDHFRSSDDFLMPRHILERAREYHREEFERDELARRRAIEKAAVNNGARQPGRCISRDGIVLTHNFLPETGWCTNNCGWRNDGQSVVSFVPDYPVDAPKYENF